MSRGDVCREAKCLKGIHARGACQGSSRCLAVS